jgi:predicted HD phosphohydrolase
VSERVCWIVQKHALFQAYYYAHFDQNCFDPDYDSLPLEFFRPIVEEVFSRPRYTADELPQAPS